MATVQPPKRRRTGYQLPLIVEGNDSALDTAMYIQAEGGERILVAVRPDVPVSVDVVPEPAAYPEPADLANISEFQPPDIDIDMNFNHQEAPPRN